MGENVAMAAIVFPGNLAAQARHEPDGDLRDWGAGLPAVVHDLAARWSLSLGLDPERVTQWLFARCVQEAVGSPFAAQVAARIAAR